jgi:hypothetical protein
MPGHVTVPRGIRRSPLRTEPLVIHAKKGAHTSTICTPVYPFTIRVHMNPVLAGAFRLRRGAAAAGENAF